MNGEFTPISLMSYLGGTYIPNLSLLIWIESFEKFVWWWCLDVYLVIGFGPTLDLGTQLMKQQSTGCPEKNDALGSSWN